MPDIRKELIALGGRLPSTCKKPPVQEHYPLIFLFFMDSNKWFT